MKNFDSEVTKKIAELEDFIGLPNNCDNTYDTSKIINYYRKTKYLLYRVFNSRKGYMHIGISEDGEYNKKCLEYQANYVARHYLDTVHGSQTILELGSGQGANLLLLADRYPEKNFIGVDLNPSIRRNRKNVSLYSEDYHKLSVIPDASVDVVYAVETLCYSVNKEQVFNQVNRVLKKDGVFIIFDGYSTEERSDEENVYEQSMSLIEYGFGMEQFEFISSYHSKLEAEGFSFTSRDLKSEVMPHMANAEARVRKYMKYFVFFKPLFALLPRVVLDNLYPVYLMSSVVRHGKVSYLLTVARKKRG